MLIENLPLVVLALIWIIVSVVQDFRKREVENWWNFSLISIALAYRAFLSVFTLLYLIQINTPAIINIAAIK